MTLLRLLLHYELIYTLYTEIFVLCAFQKGYRIGSEPYLVTYFVDYENSIGRIDLDLADP